MKACPVCGLDLEDTYLFCPEDGSPLQQPEATAPVKEPLENRIEKPSVEEPDVNPARPVILYCPACAAEYPLTFSECPVHGVPLTKHRIPTFSEPPATIVQQITEPPLKDIKTPIYQEAQNRASYSSIVAANHVESNLFDREPAQALLITGSEIEDRATGHESFQPIAESQVIAEEDGSERSSFKVAAVIIVVGLAALSLAGMYALYVNAARKPVSIAARSASQPLVATQESAFIPTPEAARDYEEPSAPPPHDAAAAGDEGRGDKATTHAENAAHSKVAVERVEERKPTAASNQPPTFAAPTPAVAKRPASATDLVLPRGTYGLVDARLIRVRGRQTASGYRYDLTFNLQEQAGRTTQWDRMAIATRSTSGINHSEVMPFYHRLGASGTLTFTISVELKGRSEADWQGRIICTSIGTDNQGRALRTSFGANVSP